MNPARTLVHRLEHMTLPFDYRTLRSDVASLSFLEIMELTKYVNEAIFAATLFSKDLSQLESGARVVDIGSGIGLTSLIMAAEGNGLEVHSYDRDSAGYHLNMVFRELLRNSWTERLPIVLDSEDSLGEFLEKDSFSYGLAFNVLEHVDSVENFIKLWSRALSNLGFLRIVCPNYLWPYEPHFNIPIVLNKNVTKLLFSKRILDYANEGSTFYDELSFPTPKEIEEAGSKAQVRVRYSSKAMMSYLIRFGEDSIFATRKKALRGLSNPNTVRALKTIVNRMPARLLPVLDVYITRD